MTDKIKYNLSQEQIDIIRHTKKLGYFSTSKGTDDSKIFEQLIKMGFAIAQEPPGWMGGDITYTLTTRGNHV